MKKLNFKRQDYKFLPMDRLREICIKKQKHISYSSYFIIIVCVITLIFCGILGWATLYTSLTLGFTFMTPTYFLSIVFSLLILFFSGGIRAESRVLTKASIVLFLLMMLCGFVMIVGFSNTGEIIGGLAFLLIGITGILICFHALSCFKDMDELRKLDGFPRFMELRITKDDFEKRVKK